jgi:hypothetical protein
MAKLTEAPPGMPRMQDTPSLDAAAEPESPGPVRIPVPPAASSPPSTEDERYFKLTKSIEVGGRVRQKLDRLLVDVTELPGAVYFELIDRYAAEFPAQYQTSFTRFRDERFLTLLLVKLNPPMIDEDVRRISFRDLPLLFTRLQASIFAR